MGNRQTQYGVGTGALPEHRLEKTIVQNLRVYNFIPKWNILSTRQKITYGMYSWQFQNLQAGIGSTLEGMAKIHSHGVGHVQRKPVASVVPSEP